MQWAFLFFFRDTLCDNIRAIPVIECIQSTESAGEKKMKTLYADVYFLINFTIDLIALCFAAKMTKLPGGMKRIVIAAALGALLALGFVFISDIPYLTYTLAFLSFLLCAVIVTGRAGVRRYVRFCLFFALFNIMLGGAVWFVYGILDNSGIFKGGGAFSGVRNRKFLILSVMIVLALSLIRIAVCAFRTYGTARTASVKIRLGARTLEVEALTDTGNLLTDPMDMSPVILLKPIAAARLFPGVRAEELGKAENIPELACRLRLIPIRKVGESMLLYGFRADEVTVCSHAVGATIAIDREGGDYGGYPALVPHAVMDL